MKTPYDREMAKLSRELDKTRMVYGKREDRDRIKQAREMESKSVAKASVASRARRADFNISESGRRNLAGEKDLVGAVTSGAVKLDAIKSEHLPEPLRKMTPAAARAAVADAAKTRQDLSEKIRVLAEKRQRHIKKELTAQGGAEDSLDEQIYSTVQAQAKKKGILYEKDGARY